MKAAIIIGHAGHELRVLKFIQLFKPLVFVLTDGSGANGVSRKESAKKIFEYYDCEISGVFCPFSDREMYGHIISGNADIFYELKEKIRKELLRADIDFIFGDACEGRNPTHDLCRYIINSIIKTYRERLPDWNIENYDFILDLLPDAGNHGISIGLSDNDKLRRDECISRYPEIKSEVDRVKRNGGERAFDKECLRNVSSYDLIQWDGDRPLYEIYAEGKIEEGKYEEIIRFEHLRKIAERL